MKILNVFTLSSTAESFFDGQFKYLSDAGHDIWLVSSSKEPTEFVASNNVKYRQFDIRRSISPFADLKTIASLSAFIRREHFDAVIGHTPKGAMIAMLAAWLAGTKNRIYYRHGLIYTTANGAKRFIFKTVERLTALTSTAIVNVSPSLSELAVADRLNPDWKQYVIGYGTCGGIDTVNIFNPEKISPYKIAELRQELGIHLDSFVIGFCGRLCRDKGIIELIEGFKLFQKRHPEFDTRLLLVGPYDERQVLPQTIKDDIESTPTIITIGRVEKTLLPAYYSLMDVFVFPSYREGFGMTVIEASAMRLPILVSRSHGCIDSIRENISGEYINLTPEGICSGIETMLDADRRNRYGYQGREFVLQNFERTTMWPRILKLYSTIMKK